MPYKNIEDLPDHVRKYPAKRQRQWMYVWNSVYRKTGDEARAFAAANSILKKYIKKEAEPTSRIIEETHYVPIQDAFDRWYQEVFGKGKYSNRQRSEGYLKDKSKQTIAKAEEEEKHKIKIEKGEIIKDKGGAASTIGTRDDVKPYWPDKGTDRLHTVPQVHVYEVPEGAQSNVFKEACEELKRKFDEALKKFEGPFKKEELIAPPPKKEGDTLVSQPVKKKE